MSTVVALDLNQDKSFIRAIWLRNRSEVIDRMRMMMKEGWFVSVDGLISSGVDGGVVIARPLKIKGSTQTTGLGIFKFKNSEL